MVVTDLVSESKRGRSARTIDAALKNEVRQELRIALDLNALWKACEKNGDNSGLYMGCVIVTANGLKPIRMSLQHSCRNIRQASIREQ